MTIADINVSKNFCNTHLRSCFEERKNNESAGYIFLKSMKENISGNPVKFIFVINM